VVSKRLIEISQLISTERLIDIGTDHGLLPIYVLERGIVAKAIGVDKSNLALGQARVNQEKSAEGEHLELVCADGLESLNVKETDCIVLAGMGGRNIVQILSSGKMENARQIITQANSNQPFLRRFLSEKGWKIESENILRHQKKLYVTISWKKGTETLTEKEISLGKILARERPELWLDWLRKERERMQKIQKSQLGIALSATQSQYLIWLEEEIALD